MSRRNTGQRRYDEVTAHEEEITRILDNIERDAIGENPAVCKALDDAESHLQDAVAELTKALAAMPAHKELKP